VNKQRDFQVKLNERNEKNGVAIELLIPGRIIQSTKNGRNYCIGEEVVIQKEAITVRSLGSSMASYKGGPLLPLT